MAVFWVQCHSWRLVCVLVIDAIAFLNSTVMIAMILICVRYLWLVHWIRKWIPQCQAGLARFILSALLIPSLVNGAPCTYHEFRCKNCSQLLGKVFRATPRGLDHLRDNYTFDVAKMYFKLLTPFFDGCSRTHEFGTIGTSEESEKDFKESATSMSLMVYHTLVPQMAKVAPFYMSKLIQRFSSSCSYLTSDWRN